MALDVKHGVRQSQQLLLSPQIQQAIKILLLSRQELDMLVTEELRDNPVLEEGDATTEPQEFGDAPESLNGQELMQQQVDNIEGSEDFRGIDELLQRFSDSLSHADEHNQEILETNDLPGYEVVDVSNISLIEELESQINLMHLTPFESDCALLLLEYLDDNGFLKTSLNEISEAHDVSIEDLEYALSVVQRCEPTGVGAKNLQECLLLQLKNHQNAPKLAKKLICDCWDELEKQDLSKIAKSLKEDLVEVKKAFNFIKNNLDPRPARQFGSDNNIQITPDVFVFKRNGKWIVSVNEDGLPRLKVSKQYENIVEEFAKCRAKGEKIDDTKLRSFLRDKIKDARWLMRAIAERNKTVVRVTEAILEKQEGFFEHGIEQLHPLTMKSISDAIGVHESTISRTTTNKYLHCSRGVFELKYFFGAGVSSGEDDNHSNETVRSWVAEYIKHEQPGAVLSDQDIVEMIEKDRHVCVARRTIAKYREKLGILSSSKRTKVYKNS